MNTMWIAFGLVGVALFVSGLVWDMTHSTKRDTTQKDTEKSGEKHNHAYAGTRS